MNPDEVREEEVKERKGGRTWSVGYEVREMEVTEERKGGRR